MSNPTMSKESVAQGPPAGGEKRPNRNRKKGRPTQVGDRISVPVGTFFTNVKIAGGSAWFSPSVMKRDIDEWSRKALPTSTTSSVTPSSASDVAIMHKELMESNRRLLASLNQKESEGPPTEEQGGEAGGTPRSRKSKKKKGKAGEGKEVPPTDQ